MCSIDVATALRNFGMADIPLRLPWESEAEWTARRGAWRPPQDRDETSVKNGSDHHNHGSNRNLA